LLIITSTSNSISLLKENCNYSKTIYKHTEFINSIIKLNNSHIVVGYEDGLIQVIDINIKESIRNFKFHEHGVFCLLKLDENIIASGSGDYTVKIINTDEGIVKHKLDRHNDGVNCIVRLDSKDIY
jgi:WD40 repeat protein